MHTKCRTRANIVICRKKSVAKGVERKRHSNEEQRNDANNQAEAGKNE